MNEMNNPTNKSTLRRIASFPQFSIGIITIATFVIIALISSNFLAMNNMVNVLRQCSTSLIVSLGMTLILILGGIDLSVGAVACLAGVLSSGLMSINGMAVGPALLVGFLVAALCGLVNGLTVSVLNIAPFISTLAMNCTARGIALVYTGGRPLTGLPSEATAIGRGFALGLPTPVWVMFVVLAVMWILITKTSFSRHVFATGGNEECARLSGVKVKKIKIICYVICSALAGICGILLTLRLGSGHPTLGDGLELDAISAAVIGGTTLTGGKGSVLGTLLGCLFLTFLSNGLNVMQVSSYWQQILKGIILIIAVGIYNRKKRR